jgi:hypothetical protein
MCMRNRLSLAAVVVGLFCSLGWLTVSGVVRGDDSSEARRNQPGYQQAASSNDTTNNAQNRDDVPAVESRPIQLAGKGRQASEKFRLEPGLCVFDIRHDGNSNLIVKLLDRNGKEIDTVFNQIGPFKGQRAINVPNGGLCLLDIQADGNWKANLSQPRPTEGQAAPCKLQGNGFATTPFVQLERGLAEFKMKHDGQQRFKVVLLDQNGRPVEYLANTLGTFDGSKPISIEEPGIYFLNVSADGNWTIDVQ